MAIDLGHCKCINHYQYVLIHVPGIMAIVAHTSDIPQNGIGNYVNPQYNTIQYNTIQYNTIQYNTIQYNTIQYNTVQYSTVQYITLRCTTYTYLHIHVYVYVYIQSPHFMSWQGRAATLRRCTEQDPPQRAGDPGLVEA